MAKKKQVILNGPVKPGVQSVKPETAEQQVKTLNAMLEAERKKNIELERGLIDGAEAKLVEIDEGHQELKVIAPNMYEDAVKTVKEFKGVKIPKSINPLEGGHYHLMAIVTEADVRTKKFVFVPRHVKLTVHGYEKHRRSYAGVDNEEWVMFHNPTLSK